MLLVVAMTAGLLATLVGSANAARGAVLVFGNELGPSHRYDNPRGCYWLPLGSHVLINQTSSFVTVYHDPLCLLPLTWVPPGYGSHVPPVGGSFRA
jgi:hypothetical protein